MTPTIEIAVFASGSGTNFENIVKYFAAKPQYNITLYTNKKNCGALTKAQNLLIENVVFERSQLSDRVVEELRLRDTQLVVLAGFLLLLPQEICQHFPCINIHPSLLPKYGGKGMYGEKVHEQVLKNQDDKTGITIHAVNQNYDEGQILFQASVELNHPNETIESIAQKVHRLEYEHYSKFIEFYLQTPIACNSKTQS